MGGDQSFGDKIPGMRSDKWIEIPLPSSPTLLNVSGMIVLLFRLKTSGSSLQWVGVRLPGRAWVVQGPSMKTCVEGRSRDREGLVPVTFQAFPFSSHHIVFLSSCRGVG